MWCDPLVDLRYLFCSFNGLPHIHDRPPFHFLSTRRKDNLIDHRFRLDRQECQAESIVKGNNPKFVPLDKYPQRPALQLLYFILPSRVLYYAT